MEHWSIYAELLTEAADGGVMTVGGWKPDAGKDWQVLVKKVVSEHYLHDVVDPATDQVIGITALFDHHILNATAEVGIVLKRDPGIRGKGVGTEAMKHTIEFGRTELRLHNLLARVSGANEPALRLFRTLGFREMGRRSESIRDLDGWVDTVFFELLSSKGDDNSTQSLKTF